MRPIILEEEMSQSWGDDPKAPTSFASFSTSHPQYISHSSVRRNNVFRLLAWREISPQTKKSSRSLWRCTDECRADGVGLKCEALDARLSLISWAEAESLQHLTAKYCPLLPPPRSTIAAAFNSDGKTLASTHGDHTVKIIDCQTGKCLKVLSGHRRTPWVVRFHPLYPEILASGSLDHEVRLWNASTAECLGSHDFHRPIASIAFHAQGELIAVASGHKLYIWNYKRRTASPTIVLKTRRSLRAVHFHPHAAPFLLTAEVNDLDPQDSPLTVATSPGYLQYPPAVFLSNVPTNSHEDSKNGVLISPVYMFWPTFVRGTSLPHENRTIVSGNENRIVGSGISQQRSVTFHPYPQQTFSSIGDQNDNISTPMETSSGEISHSKSITEDPAANCLLPEMHATNNDTVMSTAETFQDQSTPGATNGNLPNIVDNAYDFNPALPCTLQSTGNAVRIPLKESSPDAGTLGNIDLQMFFRNAEAGQFHQFFPFGSQVSWELPFLQGLLMGQTRANLHTMPLNNSLQGNLSATPGAASDIVASDLLPSRVQESCLASHSGLPSPSHARAVGQSSGRHRAHSRPVAPAGSGEGAVANNINSGVATSLAAAAAAELPCTVKLRIWPHDIQNPCAPLDSETCRLTIPHAVLCSEMGAHFSPCGRFLAACVACLLPHSEVDHGLQPQMQQDATVASSSPTRHPTSARRVMFELRIYSLEEATFGLVLASRAIRAAHCLTSVQFSPTSEHILLAYGRRHSSLLRSIVSDGETTVPIYTILEVYRVSDMELVRVLPSAEDEVNVACFHPLVGGGLVYGTKEGKLRILQYDGPHGTPSSGQDLFLDENIIEVQRYALEC